MKKIRYIVITLIILLSGMMNVIHADHKFAVIINAEGNGSQNYIRYWNDCSAVYQTLLAKGFHRDSIYVAMSDGTDPHYDIILEDGSFGSSLLDLNGDNNADIRFSATRDDIESIFYDSLMTNMSRDDDLFIYTVGEGDRTDLPFFFNYSYLMLWGGGRLKDSDLANMLAHIPARTINIVMQQSHSGGFIDALSGIDNVVITTACDAYDKSYSMENRQYDEFTYHWLCAVNGYSPFYLYPYYQVISCPYSADMNSDGYITMNEACDYARIHTTSGEFSQIESNPDCLKYSLALDALLDCILMPGWDLYIQDNTGEPGEEPNLTTPYSWISDDIWIEQDGHRIEEPLSGDTYDVCVKVRNRGEEESPGNAALCVHWTKATIGGAWPWGWYDEFTYDCNSTPVRRGDMIDSIVLPPIAGGGSYVAKIPWTTPEVEEYLPCFGDFENNPRELMHFCILARIVDEQEQPDRTITNLNLAELILNYNNVASRNVILSAVPNGSTSPDPRGVEITNPLPGQDSGPYTLTCQIEGVANWDQLATVNLTFDSQFINSQPNMTYSHCHATNSNCFELEDGAQFEDIYFSGNDNNTYPIQVNIDYFYNADFYPRFVIYLFLLDWNGNMVNGEKFEFRNNRPDLVNVIRRPTYTDEPENEIEQQSIIQEEGFSIDVYNAQGMLLKHCDNCDIPSLNLPKGIYIYRIQGENESYTKKVIK